MKANSSLKMAIIAAAIPMGISVLLQHQQTYAPGNVGVV